MKKAIIFLSVTTSQNQSIQNCIDYFKCSDGKNTDFLIVSNASHISKGITDSNQLQLTKVEEIDANQVILNLEGKLIALKLSDLQFLSAVEARWRRES